MVEYKFATQEQKELAELGREILESELKPRLHELEEANGGKGCYPLDVHKKMAEAGFTSMSIPESWGGLDFDAVTKCLVLEEMGKVDAGFTFNMYGGTVYFDHIAMSGIPEEDKQKWADSMCAGDTIIAFCLTEPQAGSDASAIKTTAVKDGNEWVINGTKCFITNGPTANLFIVYAWTDKTKSPGKGISAFLVEKERGVQVGSIENKMGIKLSCTSEIILDNVRVPEDHLIGELGRGLKYALSGIGTARVVTLAIDLGVAQAALDYAGKYAQERVTMGKKIMDHDRVADLLSHMQTKVAAARALLYYSACCIDKGLEEGWLSSATKNFIAETAMDVTIKAVQVFGGYGYMKDYPVEKLMRDAKIFEIFEGSTQINDLVIARALDAKYRP